MDDYPETSTLDALKDLFYETARHDREKAQALQKSITRVRLYYSLSLSLERSGEIGNTTLSRQLTDMLKQYGERLKPFERRIVGFEPSKPQLIRLLLTSEPIAYTSHDVDLGRAIRASYSVVTEQLDADRSENLLNGFDVEVGPAVEFDAEKHSMLPIAVPINGGHTEFHIL